MSTPQGPVGGPPERPPIGRTPDFEQGRREGFIVALRGQDIIRVALDDDELPRLSPSDPRERVVPFVGADREGIPSQMGIGLEFPDGGESTMWGLGGPHTVIQSWRAMRLLEKIGVINEELLVAAWYAARSSDEDRYIEPLTRYVDAEELGHHRAIVLEEVPPIEDLITMLRVFNEAGVSVDRWDIEAEIEAGRIAASPLIDEVFASQDLRKSERERRQKENNLVAGREIAAHGADFHLENPHPRLGDPDYAAQYLAGIEESGLARLWKEQAARLAKRYAEVLGMSVEEYIDSYLPKRFPLYPAETTSGGIFLPVLVQAPVPQSGLTPQKILEIEGVKLPPDFNPEAVEDWTEDGYGFRTPHAAYATWVDSGVAYFHGWMHGERTATAKIRSHYSGTYPDQRIRGGSLFDIIAFTGTAIPDTLGIANYVPFGTQHGDRLVTLAQSRERRYIEIHRSPEDPNLPKDPQESKYRPVRASRRINVGLILPDTAS